jgi:hypothetical protein
MSWGQLIMKYILPNKLKGTCNPQLWLQTDHIRLDNGQKHIRIHFYFSNTNTNTDRS